MPRTRYSFYTDMGYTFGWFIHRKFANNFAQAKANYDGMPVRMRKSFDFTAEFEIFEPQIDQLKGV